MKYQLLTAGEASPKVAKIHNVESAILYLAPYTVAGYRVGGKLVTVCEWSTIACRKACLFRAGRGRFDSVHKARVRRTLLLHRDPCAFHAMLDSDLHKLHSRAYRKGTPAIARLNGTSDRDWLSTYRKHDKVRFWEYTKSVARVEAYLRGEWPRNASVCYSRNEVAGDAEALRLADAGAVVAVVFATPKGAPLPNSWYGRRVTDGDLTDARYLDPPGTIVGLRAKGPAKNDRSGFVVQPNYMQG